MLTMLLGGLWHGSSWNFVIWGGIHGIVLSLEKFVFSKRGISSPGWIGYLYTFPLVLLSWVFFRSPDLESSLYIVSSILKLRIEPVFVCDINIFMVSLVVLALGFCFDLFIQASNNTLELVGAKLKLHGLVLSSSFIVLLIVLFYSTASNFIYFQF